MIDLEPDDINHLKQSKYGLMYDPQYLLSHKDGGDGILLVERSDYVNWLNLAMISKDL